MERRKTCVSIVQLGGKLSGLIVPENMNFVPKRWGYEIWICNGEKYCGKKLFIRQDKFCSFHYHKIKDEVLFIESGSIIMNWSEEGSEIIHSEKMEKGLAFHVTPGLIHQMYAIEDTVILEFSTQHFDEDSYRVTQELVTNGDSL